jgi:hypothetical protein
MRGAPTSCTASCAKHWLLELASARWKLATWPRRGGSSSAALSEYGLPRNTHGRATACGALDSTAAAVTTFMSDAIG